MSQSFNRNHIIFIILLFSLFLYQHAWSPGFFHDGHLYAAYGRTLAETPFKDWNIWISPYLSKENPSQFPHHPPLLFMIEGVFYKLFGASWLTARLLSASFAMGTLLILLRLFFKEGLSTLAFYSAFLMSILPPLFKKARSPGMDVPLMFFVMLSLYFYFQVFSKPEKKFYWILTGLGFACALWLKGPPALLIPLTIGCHILLTWKWRLLKSSIPWLSLLGAFLLFSLYPFLLWKSHHFQFFINYINAQFWGTIVEGRGEQDLRIFLYPSYLLECAGPWFILSLIGLGIILFKKIKEPSILLMVALYITVLLPFSFVRWKYSNYIVPLFPAMCVLAAYPLTKLKDKFHSIFLWIFPKLVIFLALILLIFPISGSNKRDKEVFEIMNIIGHIPNIKMTNLRWNNIDNVYPYDNLVNLLAWQRMGGISSSSTKELENFIKLGKAEGNLVFLISKNTLDKLKLALGESPFENLFHEIAYFSKYDMTILLSKNSQRSKIIPTFIE